MPHLLASMLEQQHQANSVQGLASLQRQQQSNHAPHHHLLQVLLSRGVSNSAPQPMAEEASQTQNILNYITAAQRLLQQQHASQQFLHKLASLHNNSSNQQRPSSNANDTNSVTLQLVQCLRAMHEVSVERM